MGYVVYAKRKKASCIKAAVCTPRSLIYLEVYGVVRAHQSDAFGVFVPRETYLWAWISTELLTQTFKGL